MKLNLAQRIGLSVKLEAIVMTSDSTKTLAIKLIVMALTALATYLHLKLPDDQILAFATDGVDAAFLIYGWYRTYGMKLVPHNSTALAIHPNLLPPPGVTVKVADQAAKVIGCFLAAFMFLAVHPVYAADVNSPGVQAVNSAALGIAGLGASPCTPTSCTGFYVGGGLGGVGTNLDIIGNGLNGSAFAGGILPTLDFGYLYAQNNWLFAGEFTAAYQASSSVSGGNEDGFLLTEGVKFGGNFAALFGATQAPITIPPSLANAVINVYAQGGAAHHQISGGMASGLYGGAGVMFDVGPHSFVDVDYKSIQYGATKSGTASFNSENVITAKFNYKF